MSRTQDLAEQHKPNDPLSELSRKTTAYHDAPIDRVEHARREYIEALRDFNAAQSAS